MSDIFVHCDIGLIGDALCGMPFLHDLSKEHTVIAGPNINNWVLNGIDFPVIFDSKIEKQTAHYTINASDSWQYSANGPHRHMAEGHYLVNNLQAPPLPYVIPVKSEPCNLESGIVFAPYSRTDYQGNKFWEFKNWMSLSTMLPKPIYVVGADNDDTSWTEGTDIQPVMGYSMAFVSNLLKQSKMTVTIDTGIGHLAHLLGLDNHAYLMPIVPGWPFADSPKAKKVLDLPCNVSPERMFEVCKQIPNWQ